MNRWVTGSLACTLACALGLMGCKASEDGGGATSGSGAGFGGAGGTGGAGAVGGTSGVGGTGGAGGAGAVGGTSGVGGTAGEAGVGGNAGEAGVGGMAGTGGVGGTGGTGGVGGGSGNNRVAANQVCQRLAELQCAAETTCCLNDGRKYPSTNDCINNQRNVCETTFRVSTIGADPEAGYSMDEAEAAFDYFETLVSTCDTNVVAWGTSSQGFLRMMQGTKGQNSFCMPTSGSDYGAAFSCNFSQGLTCVPGIPGTMGLPPTGWSCKPRSGAGGSCYSDLNCQDGLRCEAPETLSDCVSRKSLGASCTYALECASLFCEDNECVEANVEDAYCLGG